MVLYRSFEDDESNLSVSILHYDHDDESLGILSLGFRSKDTIRSIRSRCNWALLRSVDTALADGCGHKLLLLNSFILLLVFISTWI